MEKKMNIKQLAICGLLVISLFVFETPPSSTHAQTDEPGVLDLIGQIGGYTTAVFVTDNIAYIDDGARLTLIDVSNPNTPTIIGKSDPLTGIILEIKVSNDVAYVANHTDGLTIFDVSDPTSPTIIGAYQTEGLAMGVDVVDGIAYVPQDSMGVQVIDVTNPAAPTLISTFSTAGRARRIDVIDTTAYIADNFGGVAIVDVSDPNSVTLLGTYDVSGSARDVEVIDGVLYAAYGNDGLIILDVSNPATPVLIGEYVTDDIARAVQLVNDVAYVADSESGVIMLDVADPANPTLISTYDTVGEAISLQIINNTAYVTDNYDGLKVLDLTDLTTPLLLSKYNTTGYAYGTDIVGSTAYIADYENGLAVVDVSNPADPAFINAYHTDGLARDVLVVDGLAYVADEEKGLIIVDVTNPNTLTLKSDYATAGTTYSVDVESGIAYVADGENGLLILDVRDPENLTLLSSHESTGQARYVNVINDTAYLADGAGGLQIIDVFIPTQPTLVGSYDTGGQAHHVEVIDRLAYIADWGDGLVIVDVSKPEDPVHISTLDTDGLAETVRVVGNAAYVADYYNGVVAIDIADAAYPELVGTYKTAGYANGLNVVDDLVYVASDLGGMSIMRLRLPDDSFEYNDDCANATPITTNGLLQNHSFHDVGDVDWVKFSVNQGQDYVVTGSAVASSLADLVVGVYAECDEDPIDGQDESFSPSIRLDFAAHATGMYYVKVNNQDKTLFGEKAKYSLSVKAKEPENAVSAVIIVAGRMFENDRLQSNIHHVTDKVYSMFTDNGVHPDHIQYLATDLTLDPANDGFGVDAEATLANLENAITVWALNHADEDSALTLYMMSHGIHDQFYLNENEKVTPKQLNIWLTQLEDDVRDDGGGDVKINVVIDACHSGSFIDSTDTISKQGRVIVASTSRNLLAYASDDGARFSDFFTFALQNDYTAYGAFEFASDAATRFSRQPQTPWLDDNGNGTPNDPEDGVVAAARSFGFAGTFSPPIWEPSITKHDPVAQRDDGAEIRVQVKDDRNVTNVRAYLSPPSYIPPDPSGERLVIDDRRRLQLTPTENGYYEVTFCPDELGTWSVSVEATDNDGLTSRPRVITFEVTELPKSCQSTPMAVSTLPLHIQVTEHSILLWATLLLTTMIGFSLLWTES